MTATTTLLLGPVLALVPILVWELWLRPSRVRRNLALSVLSEVDINLHWVFGFARYREEHARALLTYPMARKLVMESCAHELGELPRLLADNVLRFYANIDEIVATNEYLRYRQEALARSVDQAHSTQLNSDISQGHAYLTHIIPESIKLGDTVRTQLHALASGLSFAEELPPLRSIDAVQASAWVTDGRREGPHERDTG